MLLGKPDTSPLELFWLFIRERHQIWDRRNAGWKKPWTNDEILQQYKFCNVYRELDAVTVWIRENWRVPNDADPDLWFAMAVARFLNKPHTLAAMGYPVPWKPRKLREAVDYCKRAGVPVFNAAYIISTAGRKIDKIDYVVEVMDALWARRKELRPTKGDTLGAYHLLLGEMYGVGSFLTAQIIADVKYHNNPLRYATDWWTFAASGPGSRRGLNRVLSYPVKDGWNEDEWRMELERLQEVIDSRVKAIEMPRIHAQDLQNCLCEFDKYCRARSGEGRPKQKFDGVKK